ncbi:MAG: 30S ribosome-binding factor RbfA [Gammaproteobacteria bacterium]|nr:30S ribosome-binding factor RbfA [Gammaproteobacteria bacterium]
MPEMSPRAQRVADQIQREIAHLIQLEVCDPRVGMVSVTGVDVSNDLASANVYVTAMQSMVMQGSPVQLADDQVRLTTAIEIEKSQIDENVNALNKAAGYLRSLLARRLSLRAIPKLRFHYDSSIERGQRLSALIDNALAADRQLQSD